MQYVAIIAYGVAVHAILLMSVFSVYFTTNILRGIEPAPRAMRYQAPARRVVLILSDGLRADKCFGTKRLPASIKNDAVFAAPYLRSIAKSVGVWGVSHTRVPTESRPGTVALVAGLYEDVSAITRGWKENPIEFDSIFNQSRHSFCWGSPDTVSMFSSSSSSTGMRMPTSNVYADTYDHSLVDFGAQDPSSLDAWVLNRFKLFLVEAEQNETIKRRLANDQILFFMHLLGMDILGHTRKPNSLEYTRGISVVDAIVNDTVSLISNYFNDDKTAFVFTADHGMTDWGSHGSSDTEETETPFLAWGAGIRQPSSDVEGRNSYDLNTSRHDVNQADITPLMASLLGVPIPVNSVGILPEDILDCHDDDDDHHHHGGADWCTEALSANAKQLAAQFERHWADKESSSFFFRPFKGLSKSQLRTELETLSSPGFIVPRSSRREAAKSLMKTIRIGIRYFETYDRFSLCVCVTSGFLGWMFFVVTLHLRIKPILTWRRTTTIGTKKFFVVTIAIVMSSFIVCLSYLQSEPVSYYVYRLFPVVTWTLVFYCNCKDDDLDESVSTSSAGFQWDTKPIWRTLARAVLLGFALELLVITFYRREALAIELFLVGFYPIVRDKLSRIRFRRRRLWSSIAWLMTCILMAAAYLVWTPIGTSANHALVGVAVLSCLAIVVATIVFFKSSVFVDGSSQVVVVGVQGALLCATLLVRLLLQVDATMQQEEKWTWLIRMTSWTLLFTCNLVPLFGDSETMRRLFGLTISLVTSYLLLSYAQEALLCVLFTLLLGLWLFLEHQWLEDNSSSSSSTSTMILTTISGTTASDPRSSNKDDQLNWDAVRLAYFSLFLAMLAFFGLGNSSNVNSFSLDSVFHFVTLFSPFTMGALLLWKVLCPFLLVALYVRAVHEVRQQQQQSRPRAMTMVNSPLYIVLLLCDFMALQFFYMVRDEGSWLDIGTSLGHFVIAIVATIAIAALHLVAKIMMTVTLTLKLADWSRRRKTHFQ